MQPSQGESVGSAEPAYRIRMRDVALEAGTMRWMWRAADALSKVHSPLLAQIRQEPTTELSGSSLAVHADGVAAVKDPLTYQILEFQYQFALDNESTLSWDVSDMLLAVDDMARAKADQLTKGMLDHISRVAESAGNVSDARGMNPWDAIIDSVTKLSMTFDEDGEHHTSLVVHPDTYRRLANSPPTEAQKRRMDELLAEKRREYRAARRLRELP